MPPTSNFAGGLGTAGVDNLRDATKALEDQIKRVFTEQLALNMALQSPAYREAKEEVDNLRKANERLASGKRELTRIEQMQAAAAQRRAALQSGAYATELRQLGAIKREHETLASAERRVELQQQYGRSAGALAHAAERFTNSRAGMVATGMGLSAAGMARQGLQGTVEQERLSNEWQQLNREMAGAVKPFVDSLTKGLRMINGALKLLPEGGQDILGAGIVASGAYGTYGAAKRFMGAAGGVRGAAVSAAPGTLASTAIAAQAGSVAIGATAAKRGGLAAIGRTAARFAPPVAAALVVNDAIIGAGGEETWYAKNRRAGTNAFSSTINAFGASVGSYITGDQHWEDRIAARAKENGINYLPGAGGGHRTVTEMPWGNESADESFNRISNEFNKQTTGDNTFADIGADVKLIADYLREIRAHRPMS